MVTRAQNTRTRRQEEFYNTRSSGIKFAQLETSKDPSSRPITRYPDDVPAALVTGTEGFILSITTSSSRKTERRKTERGCISRDGSKSEKGKRPLIEIPAPAADISTTTTMSFLSPTILLLLSSLET
ncbi:hypothetical protein FF1_035384 [Malus domestica]